jgi:uncharacterized protein YbjT (DUF2867 family)
VFNSALFDDVPHFAGKYLVERVIDAQAIPATVLRPAYFMQNDLMFRDALKAGIYPQPIGGVGVTMVDIRDIAMPSWRSCCVGSGRPIHCPARQSSSSVPTR